MEKALIKPQVKKRFPWGERIFIWAMLAYPLIQLAIFYFYVNFSSFTLAFKDLQSDMSYKWVGFSKFAEVWTDFFKADSLLMRSFWNSLLRFAVSFTIRTPLVFLFAFYVFKRFPGAALFRIVAMLPTIISSVIVGLVFKEFMEALPQFFLSIGIKIPDLMNDPSTVFWVATFYGMWLSFNTAAIVYPNRMNSVDGALIESAQLEGCSTLQELWYILIPLVFPTFTTYTVLAFSGLFTESGAVFTLYGYNALPETYNLGYYIFVKTTSGANKTSWYSYVAALGLMLSCLSIPITFGVKKLLEKVDPMND